ncbi:MAG: monofunctional biosynthetic peptidoglycan transglycosylase [Bacteroidetes bacterium]|nr:MAG: monofunctional biosynthetic peptidoglycan transglycosylase [Bacteroidota bacterium]
MRNLRKWFFRIILCLTIAFFRSTIFFVLLYKFVPPPITPLMVVRLIEEPVKGQTHRLYKDWVPLKEISPNLQLAVVASEDNRFLEHFGFDMDAIEKAQEFNENQKGRRLHGASTISQQTAKNVFLWPQRSWVRKGLEVYFTFLIELTWSKRRIMEVYLNVIEMGKGIYGAEAAAQSYFHKPSSKLTRSESALIAAILPDPRRRNPVNPTPFLLERQQWILWNMTNIGKIDY